MWCSRCCFVNLWCTNCRSRLSACEVDCSNKTYFKELQLHNRLQPRCSHREFKLLNVNGGELD